MWETYTVNDQTAGYITKWKDTKVKFTVTLMLCVCFFTLNTSFDSVVVLIYF